MEIVEFKGVEVDRCTGCKGLWFDLKEEVQLGKIEGAESIDEGDAFVGAKFNEVRQIKCPRCEVDMFLVSETKPAGIYYESCPRCYGAFFDAGEFTDYLEEQIVERFSKYQRDRKAK
jgi:Zn-finger nucleic acid-binding protein